MCKALLILLLAVGTGERGAVIYEVGGRKLTIPAPPSFTLVTNDMPAVYRMSLHLADPTNEQLAYYIPDSLVPAAKAGAMLPLERTFLVKVSKKLKGMVVGSSDFGKLKTVVKKENDEIFQTVRKQMPDIMKGTSEGISKEFDVDFAVRVSQIVPLAPHYESDNALAYSMYINYDFTAAGDKATSVVAATTTIANVSGKILFLYCYAPKAELEWTRNAAKAWTAEVMARNAEPPEESSGFGGFNWKEIGGKAVIGGIAGGLIALISWLLSGIKRKKVGGIP